MQEYPLEGSLNDEMVSPTAQWPEAIHPRLKVAVWVMDSMSGLHPSLLLWCVTAYQRGEGVLPGVVFRNLYEITDSADIISFGPALSSWLCFYSDNQRQGKVESTLGWKWHQGKTGIEIAFPRKLIKLNQENRSAMFRIKALLLLYFIQEECEYFNDN